VVSFHDGVLVVEDAGRILRNDRVFDLPMETIELVPSGDGYEVSFIPPAFEPVNGQAVFVNETEWAVAQIALNSFAFPFGGEDRTTFWMTTANLISFEPPTEPVKIGLCSDGCYYAEGHVLLDRTPRISPLQHGSFHYGRNAWIQGGADRAVITWQYDNPENLNVQVVFFPDGRIRLNYAAVSGIQHGAPVVVTGNDSFWSDLRLGGEVTDPEGDVPIPDPDGPAMDLLAVTARQVGTSELLQVEIDLAAPPPPFDVSGIYYRIELKDRSTDPEPLGSILLQWRKGSFYFASEPVELEGSKLRLNLRLHGLPLTGDDLHLTVSTFRGSGPFEDGDEVELTAEFATPDGRMMLDLSEDLPVTLGNRPVYEAFTYPALQTGEVLEALAPLFEDPSDVEAFTIFQNLQTDIWFFGGGYHAGGNSGADGIGFGSSSEPRSPSLLHVNNIHGYYSEERTMTVLSHELGHRWLYHFAIDEGEGPSRILNPLGSHPAGWVHTPAVRSVYKPLDYSVMGGSYWQPQPNGTFRSPTEAEGGGNGFSWHELYMIGLAGPEEVDRWWYIRDPNPPLPGAYWPPNDIVVTGEIVPVDLDQVTAVEGPRYPAYPDALQHFLTPVVLVVRPGAFTPEEVDTTTGICDVWQTRFHEATDFRGSLRCRFQPPEVSITSPASDLSIPVGTTVEFEGTAADGDGDDVELRWSFPGAAPGATGEGPHPVTYASTGVYTTRLDGVDEVGMLATGQATLQVTVECPTTPPAEAVSGLRLGKEGMEIRFTWLDLATPPTDYVVLSSDAPNGPFLPRAHAASGNPGLLLEVAEDLAFFEVAAREDPGCLGPY
jgi:hypothetical protein